MRKRILSLFLLLAFSASVVQARRGGGGGFAGGFAGGMFGGLISGAMTRGREKVIIKEIDSSNYQAAINNLENAVRYDLLRLNDKIRDLERDLQDVKEVKTQIKNLGYQLEKLDDKFSEMEKSFEKKVEDLEKRMEKEKK